MRMFCYSHDMNMLVCPCYLDSLLVVLCFAMGHAWTSVEWLMALTHASVCLSCSLASVLRKAALS